MLIAEQSRGIMRLPLEDFLVCAELTFLLTENFHLHGNLWAPPCYSHVESIVTTDLLVRPSLPALKGLQEGLLTGAKHKVHCTRGVRTTSVSVGRPLRSRVETTDHDITSQ